MIGKFAFFNILSRDVNEFLFPKLREILSCIVPLTNFIFNDTFPYFGFTSQAYPELFNLI
jgi:hypothetical protein